MRKILWVWKLHRKRQIKGHVNEKIAKIALVLCQCRRYLWLVVKTWTSRDGLRSIHESQFNSNRKLEVRKIHFSKVNVRMGTVVTMPCRK